MPTHVLCTQRCRVGCCAARSRLWGSAIAFELLWAVTGFGGPALKSLATNWVYMGVEFVAIGVCAARVAQRREQRLAWTLMTVALVCWSVGDLLWAVWLDNVATRPIRRLRISRTCSCTRRCTAR